MSIPSSVHAANPFYQPVQQWQIRIITGKLYSDAIEDAFADMALASTRFELEEDGESWCVDILVGIKPTPEEVTSRLALTAQMLSIDIPSFEISLLEMKDWLSEVERSFPPLHVGRFYVYGSHVKTGVPNAVIPLKINAGRAFGSGEHATTSGCLHALGDLARKRHFRRPLDMGCGSGILAIAMAKLWHVKTVGVDIDPMSVQVSRENACKNQVKAFTAFNVSNGYESAWLKQQAPFDIIVANILARPLVAMAPALAHMLAPGGVAVLSGLLDSQETKVLTAHRLQGLHLIKRYSTNHWQTLVIGF